ncbi:haloacid dehalogenase-like hydrolase [Aeromonas schubertii]|uniref:Haloacid dehalogenase-like hydrolase n=1 Tax=Aeromonas schubertii TaxID=652 RepID=A0ABS7VDI9_9GAMM|nr:haloacid dehalogenase-like hydrolase [Aeromonas schubertii]MBZ6067427.1 haloacid dehalogenase-like hydrolase [Aeromonas schubertii]
MNLILADYDGTLTAGDSHGALLRHILLRRRWPLLLVLLLSPLLLLLGLLSRPKAVWLLWWCATLGGDGWSWRCWVADYARREAPLFTEARALLVRDGERVWVVSASPRALVRRRLHHQLGGLRVGRVLGSRMGFSLGAIVPRHYSFGAAKRDLLPGMESGCAELALSDALSDLPLLALGQQAWLINPSPRRLAQGRERLPELMARHWH